MDNKSNNYEALKKIGEELDLYKKAIEEEDENYLKELGIVMPNEEKRTDYGDYKIITFLTKNFFDKFLNYVNLTKEEWDNLDRNKRKEIVNNLSERILKKINITDWDKLKPEEKNKIIDSLLNIKK